MIAFSWKRFMNNNVAVQINVDNCKNFLHNASINGIELFNTLTIECIDIETFKYTFAIKNPYIIYDKNEKCLKEISLNALQYEGFDICNTTDDFNDKLSLYDFNYHENDNCHWLPVFYNNDNKLADALDVIKSLSSYILIEKFSDINFNNVNLNYQNVNSNFIYVMQDYNDDIVLIEFGGSLHDIEGVRIPNTYKIRVLGYLK